MLIERQRRHQLVRNIVLFNIVLRQRRQAFVSINNYYSTNTGEKVAAREQ